MTEDRKRWVGQVVNGEFELRQYLGGSESTAVFLTDRGERRLQEAAVKIIPANRRSVERQLSRWTTATKLSNPHLLRIFESGRCKLDNSDFIYVVIEYAEEDLSQILPTRPLTPSETRDMLIPALDALSYLHAKGFVHGRIKPANIMAISDQIKLSSDGIRSMREPPESPERPESIDTLPQRAGIYDPPEAASGVVSPAGDVWSLGITLVEVLTQHPPTRESDRQAQPLAPKIMSESLPAPFLEIVRRCLLIEPQQRCSVAEIAALLNPSASARPVPRITPPIAATPSGTPPSADVSTTIPPRPPLPGRTTAAPPRPPARPQARSLTVARPRKENARSRYLIPAIAAAFVLAAILGGARLLNRREAQQTSPPSPIAPQSSSSASQSADERQPALRQIPESAREQSRTTGTPRPAEIKPPSKQSPAKRDSESAANASDLENKPQRPQTFGASRGVRSDAAVKSSAGRGVSGEVLQQDLPNVSAKAQASIQGKVRVTVKILVDQSGAVTKAELVSPGPSKYFADLALKSARRWEFAPAKLNNQYVPSEWSLRYEFGSSGTKVYPQQTSP